MITPTTSPRASPEPWKSPAFQSALIVLQSCVISLRSWKMRNASSTSTLMIAHTLPDSAAAASSTFCTRAFASAMHAEIAVALSLSSSPMSSNARTIEPIDLALKPDSKKSTIALMSPATEARSVMQSAKPDLSASPLAKPSRNSPTSFVILPGLGPGGPSLHV
eukprot:3874641-Prymnesium_polylepis.1